MALRVLDMDSLQDERDRLREQLREALGAMREQADALDLVARVLDEAGCKRDARPVERIHALAAERDEARARLEMVGRWVGLSAESIDLKGRLPADRLAELISIVDGTTPIPPDLLRSGR